MKKRTILTLLAAFVVLLILVSIGVDWYLPYDTYRGKVYDTFEASRGRFTIRMVAQHEMSYLPNFVPGAYLTFYSKVTESKDWVEVFHFRLDDPVDIPEEYVRIVNKQFAYLYGGRFLAVTTDAGRSWSKWDIYEQLSWGCGPPEQLAIRVDGTGDMTIHLNDYYCKDPVKHFVTRDFGRTWTPASMPDTSAVTTPSSKP